MTEVRKTIRLYEALELRGEYDARIKTLRDCLPEARQNRNLFSRTTTTPRVGQHRGSVYPRRVTSCAPSNSNAAS